MNTIKKIKRIGLKHINYLTDDFGIWQHTNGRKIDKKHGYALDDVARGLLLALKVNDKKKRDIYFDFLKLALGNGQIINFFNKEKGPLEKPWSEDALGEAYWSLSQCAAAGYREKEAARLLKKIEPIVRQFISVRGRSYALLGACSFNKPLAVLFASSILKQYKGNSSKKWRWPENFLSYANSIVPLAMLAAAAQFNKKSLKEAGLDMLNFLNLSTDFSGVPIVVGNRGWYSKGQKLALFDQQPIDAGYQVLANVEAWKQSQKEDYLDQAKKYFSWFWGNNLTEKPLIDIESERCRDGFSSKKVDKNSGAESTICYLLAQEEIWPHLFKRESDYIRKDHSFE